MKPRRDDPAPAGKSGLWITGVMSVAGHKLVTVAYGAPRSSDDHLYAKSANKH